MTAHTTAHADRADAVISLIRSPITRLTRLLSWTETVEATLIGARTGLGFDTSTVDHLVGHTLGDMLPTLRLIIADAQREAYDTDNPRSSTAFAAYAALIHAHEAGARLQSLAAQFGGETDDTDSDAALYSHPAAEAGDALHHIRAAATGLLTHYQRQEGGRRWH